MSSELRYINAERMCTSMIILEISPKYDKNFSKKAKQSQTKEFQYIILMNPQYASKLHIPKY